MVDHIGIGVADVARSAALYDAAFGVLGLRRAMLLPFLRTTGRWRRLSCRLPGFWIDRFHPHGVKHHTAFSAKSCAEVDAFNSVHLAFEAR